MMLAQLITYLYKLCRRLNIASWNIDWTKVETLDDIKRILQATRLTFQGEAADWKQIDEFLVFNYPNKENNRD